MQLCLLSQVQATVVGFLAAVAAICLGAISRGGVELDQAAVLCASSITTAFLAALSLGKTSCARQADLSLASSLTVMSLFKGTKL